MRPGMVRTFRIGDKPKRGEGLRVGTTRYPPRGVSKSGRKKFFDVWFPVVAPSVKLLRSKRGTKAFFDAYRRELEGAEDPKKLSSLARLARRVRSSRHGAS